MQDQQPRLKREIGVWGLSANIINIIVGAGIFVLPAVVAQGMGASSIIAYLSCGLLVILVMLCFAEVGSRVTGSGGAYAYIHTAFGRFPGYLTAVFFLAACVTADAAVANALAGILASVFPFFGEAAIKTGFFLLLFGGLAWINMRGVKRGIGLVQFNTVAKLLPMLLLVFIGWKDVTMENLQWQEWPEPATVAQMSLLLFFAFQGGESGLAVSGEVRNPAKTIPRAIMISILGVMGLYLLIQLVSQGILGADLPAYKEGPLAEAGRVMFGPLGFTLVTVGAAYSMFGTLSGTMLSIPRVAYSASRDGVIGPRMLARVHPRFATPNIAIGAYASFVCILAIMGGFRQLAVASGAFMLMIYLGVVLCVFRLRQTASSDATTFRMPGGLVIPVIAILAILGVLSGLEQKEWIAGLIFSGIFSGIYLLMNLMKRRNIVAEPVG